MTTNVGIFLGLGLRQLWHISSQYIYAALKSTIQWATTALCFIGKGIRKALEKLMPLLPDRSQGDRPADVESLRNRTGVQGGVGRTE
jgi:hypothetical protein